MYIISAKSNRKPKNTLPTGFYSSEVKNVRYDQTYVVGESVIIEYTLTDEKGKIYPYRESFYIKDFDNPRTVQFLDYIEDHGIGYFEDGLPDLVGFCEKLELKRKVGFNKPIIVSREFVERKEGTEDELQG